MVPTDEERILALFEKLPPRDRPRLLEQLRERALGYWQDKIDIACSIGSPTETTGQITGDWYGPDRRIPHQAPPFDATGAIFLPEEFHGKEIPDQSVSLLLVNVSGVWVPLSEAAIDTYIHSRGMFRSGEQWTFVVREDEDTVIRQKFFAKQAAKIPPDQIEERYGTVISQLARADRKALQVTLNRVGARK